MEQFYRKEKKEEEEEEEGGVEDGWEKETHDNDAWKERKWEYVHWRIFEKEGRIL